MTNSIINQSFKIVKKENRPALVTYTVAGDNNKKKSLEILKSISKHADICELGFPHNTPIADGGQINDVFSIASQFKKSNKNKPIILMGYYNMIYQYGEDRFIAKCKRSNVDGLIVVDLPYPENKNFASKCKKNKINFIQLVSPTTTKTRLKQIIKDSHDMIYYISMLSTTGGKLKVSPKKILKEYFKIKKYNKLKNIVIGFGITEKTIKSLKRADGLVVGSAICKEITKSIEKRQNTVTNVTKLVLSLKNKIA